MVYDSHLAGRSAPPTHNLPEVCVAMIVVAAVENECRWLLSEVMQGGVVIDDRLTIKILSHEPDPRAFKLSTSKRSPGYVYIFDTKALCKPGRSAIFCMPQELTRLQSPFRETVAFS